MLSKASDRVVFTAAFDLGLFKSCNGMVVKIVEN